MDIHLENIFTLILDDLLIYYQPTLLSSIQVLKKGIQESYSGPRKFRLDQVSILNLFMHLEVYITHLECEIILYKLPFTHKQA